MKTNLPNNKIPKISDKDLKMLFDYAEKISVIGERYGMPTILSIYKKAYNQIKKNEKI
jgi:rRNA maturation protein Rpf1